MFIGFITELLAVLMPGTLPYIPAKHIDTTLATIVIFTAIRHVLTVPDPKLLIQCHL